MFEIEFYMIFTQNKSLSTDPRYNMNAMSLSLKVSFVVAAAICILHSADSTCTEPHNNTVARCLTSFIIGDLAAFPHNVGSSSCNVDINCTALNDATECLNTLSLPTDCRQTLEPKFNGLLAHGRTPCTVNDFYAKCPRAPRLDMGNSCGRPGNSCGRPGNSCGRPAGPLLFIIGSVISVLMSSFIN